MPFLSAGGHRLEYVRLGHGTPGRPTLVFLHEGLGSVALWRDFPERVAAACRCDAVVYSRYGYGQSDPLREDRPVRFMHDEALVTLPALLDQLGVARPLLVGHSDGASIALLHAGGAGRPVAGLVLLAPHVLVEDVTVASIAAARASWDTTDLRERLSRYHAEVDSAFLGWCRVWLDPAFRSWNIEEFLPAIRCPALAIQGADDVYGTMEQLRRIATAVPQLEVLALDRCGHSPHRDRPAEVLAALVPFVDRVAAGG